MENIREFMDELSSEIMEMLPKDLTEDLFIDQATVTKMNDQVLYGLTFKREEENAAPTIYVNEEFENHRSGKPMEMISGQMVQAYLDSLVARTESIPKNLEMDNVKENLTIRIVEIKRNRRYLSEIPYMPLGNGLAAVCDLKLQEGDEGTWRTTITRDLVDRNNYDMSELFAAALEHAPKVDPPVLCTMESHLFGFEHKNFLESGKPEDGDKESMYILSNESGMLGAAVLFYPGVQEEIADVMGEGYSVLPSSVHEVLIVPDSLAPNQIELAEMVRRINRDVVDPKEVLSDNVMHYDKETRELTTSVHSLALEEKTAESRC